jgi:hypothetical protein
MKRFLALCALVGLLAGCENKSTSGGPGTTNPDSKKSPVSLGQPENTFKFSVPKTDTSIKQGETKQVTISADRGKNFDQDMKYEFSGAPMGVTIAPSSGTFKAGDKDMTVSIAAAKDAALGEHTITLTGTPSKSGDKATAEFKINVKKA